MKAWAWSKVDQERATIVLEVIERSFVETGLYPTYRTISDFTGHPVSMIGRYLDVLHAQGRITVYPHCHRAYSLHPIRQWQLLTQVLQDSGIDMTTLFTQ